MSYEDYLIREMTVGETTNNNEAQTMNEEDAKMIADLVIEWLHGHGYISEEKYGKIPVTVPEDIAKEIVDVMSQ